MKIMTKIRNLLFWTTFSVSLLVVILVVLISDLILMPIFLLVRWVDSNRKHKENNDVTKAIA